jgi:predicted amidohydrolase
MEAIAGGRPLRLAIYQHGCGLDDLPTRLQRLDHAMAKAAGRRADLLICPELFLSGYDNGAEHAQSADGPNGTRAAELASQHGIGLVVGYAERDGERIFNAALCLGKDGQRLANHRKCRLPTPFERKHFECGDTPTRFMLEGWRIAVAICCEIEYPEIARRAALDSAALLATPTALLEEWSAVAHRVIPARAFENCFYVAYANYAGVEGRSRYLGASVIAGPRGDDCARGGAQEELLVAELNSSEIVRARERLAYLNDRAGL